MNINITQGITGFFSIFNALYNWLANFNITIGDLSFSFIDLIVSILVIDMFIWFVFKIIGGD